MMNFINGNFPQAHFDQWMNALEKLLKQRPYNNLNTFLSMSETLFGKNVMYKSATISWSADNNNFTFKSDSIPEVIFKQTELKMYQ